LGNVTTVTSSNYNIYLNGVVQVKPATPIFTANKVADKVRGENYEAATKIFFSCKTTFYKIKAREE